MDHRTLISLSQKAEEAASILVALKDSLSFEAIPKTTAVVGDLFAISAGLRELVNLEPRSRGSGRVATLNDDVRLVVTTITFTLDDVLTSFVRTRTGTRQALWDELNLRMAQEELVELPERLVWYRRFLQDCLISLVDRSPSAMSSERKRLFALSERQQLTRLARQTLDRARPVTPSPRLHQDGQWPGMKLLQSPNHPSEQWDYRTPPPLAPDPPVSLSPTFTNDSSQSFFSSETSMSSSIPPISTAHWAQDIFDGNYPQTPFHDAHQSDDPAQCYGNTNPLSLSRLRSDGFEPIVSLPFERETLWVYLYWRPMDGRVRILVLVHDTLRQDLLYCVPLTSLKVIRNKSCLQLCRASRNGTYELWSRLNFALYERMALFYLTFIAAKHQDRAGIEDPKLLDSFELHEEAEFEGQIRDGNVLHGLRLFRDQASGVLRIEASVLHGPMRDVPIWTAFLTKYAGDPDHFQDEGRGVVNVITLRPPPYYFQDEYRLPIGSFESYTLKFASTSDAQAFVNVWRNLCRAMRG